MCNCLPPQIGFDTLSIIRIHPWYNTSLIKLSKDQVCTQHRAIGLKALQQLKVQDLTMTNLTFQHKLLK